MCDILSISTPVGHPFKLVVMPLLQNFALDDVEARGFFVFGVNEVENIVPQVVLFLDVLEEAFIVVSVAVNGGPFGIADEALLFVLELPIFILWGFAFLLVDKHTDEHAAADHYAEETEYEVGEVPQTQFVEVSDRSRASVQT